MLYLQRINIQSVIVPVVGLLILAILIAVFRLHTYNEPLERDITTYAIIGHGLITGKALYSDLWDHKPPAVYLSFALAELIFGYGNREVYGINVVVCIITLFAVYIAGTRYSGGTVTGLIAGTAWVLLSPSLNLQANQPNSEVFLNCCLAAIFAILINSKKLGKKTVFFAGLLTALASLYKPIAIPPVFCLLAARIIFSDSQNRKTYFWEAINIGIIVALVWLLVIMWFVEAGSFTDFYQIVFRYNSTYAGIGTVALEEYWKCLSWGMLLDPHLLAILGIATAVGIITIILRNPLSRLWIYWLAYSIGTVVAVVLPNHPFSHYFQLPLPMAAIGFAWALNSVQNTLAKIFTRLLTFFRKSFTTTHYACLYTCLWLAAMMPLFLDRINELSLPPDEWSKTKYYTVFIDHKVMAEKLKSLLLPNETLWIWGDATGLYFYSKRFPASGMLVNDSLYDREYGNKWSARVLLQLIANPPTMFIYYCDDNKDLAKKFKIDRDREHLMDEHVITSWLTRNYYFYKVIEVDNRYFALFLLPNSPLFSRLCPSSIN